MSQHIPRISRRLLMRGGVAAGLLMATGAHAAGRRVAGELRIAVEALPDGCAGLMTGDCLTEIAEGGGLVGELAESWDSVAATDWVFRLRAGIVDHGGQPFDAAAAALALRDIAGLDQLREVSAQGRDLRIRLAEADADFPLRLADPRFVLRGAESAGTGLYRPIADAEGRFERVARHYKDGRAGWFEAVTLVAIAGAEARTEAVLAGEVDLAIGVPVAARLAVRRGVAMQDAEGATLVYRTALGRPEGGASLELGRIAERWWLG